ncbi:protoporphyrinogen oxidase [Peribacillus deserti]|uniref:Coproporphyrinogen III oxidase n=1 Tax=Peribacillus deserti TaxID=673318 RepID=A0A2N5M079_9BACI|nr:protoporphyrinogen oxidase [Peribacillus deserti]PLT27725.1 protoporphyrinogen oxidase [Peribacillus deserti]
MNQRKQRVVVIGGGITGLTAAYYLIKKAREDKLSLEVILIEAGQRLGGKIQTTIKDGFVIEKGPESILARKQSASRLAREVGMEDKLVYNTDGRSFVLVRERLHGLPGGSMGIPARIGPFVTTGLFSPIGKLRAAADFILPRSSHSSDQSLGAFFRRRFGDEVVENLIEPLLSGIYAGDIDRISLLATFPQFHQVEQQYRSMILGLKKDTPAAKILNTKDGFLTFTSGLESFVTAIESKLHPATVLKGVKVEKVVREGADYTLFLNSGHMITADAVIAAVPHLAVQQIFSAYTYFDELKEMPANSVATIAMAFDESAIKKDIEGTGFVVSRNSDYTITSCTWIHKKWPHSTPHGKVLLRTQVGRAGDQTIVELSDEEIEKIVLEDLNKTMDITSKPEFTIVTRWKDAMPQYNVGHKQRITALKQQLSEEMPGIILAGSSYEGLGLPDCIDQGEEAVELVLEYLAKK